ncbi:MAG: tetratricopeptide repeat protein [Pikeienuella sp.]
MKLGQAWRASVGAAVGAIAVALAAAADADILPAPGGQCRACYALVVDAGQSPGLTSATTRRAALERRGFEVVSLERPPAHRLIYETDRLFRRFGSEPRAQLVFWYAGPVEGDGEDGLALLLPGRSSAAGADAIGVPGLDVRVLLDRAETSEAASAVVVLDAGLPRQAPLPLGPEPADPARWRYVLGGSVGAGAAPLGPILEELLRGEGPLSIEALETALSGLARLGYLGAAAEPEPAAGAAAAPGLGAALAGGAGRVPVPQIASLRGLEAPAVSMAESGALCDRLAADPADRDIQMPGVQQDRIDGRAAAPACLAALFADPSTLRYAYQYGRALKAMGQATEAAAWFDRAASLGHAPAGYARAVALLTGDGVPVDEANGLALLEQSAAQAYAPALAQLAQIALSGRSQRIRPDRVLPLLRRGARAGDPQVAFALAEFLMAQRSPSESQLIEALENYRIAGRARLPGAVEGAARAQEMLQEVAIGAKIAECEGLLRFRIRDVEGAAGLGPGSGIGEWLAAQKDQIRRVLGAVPLRRAAEVCGPLVGEDELEPGLLAKIGYLGYRGRSLGGPGSIGGESWENLIARAAIAGDPEANYVRGYVRFGETLNSGDGRRARAAVENFDAACAGGVPEGCYLSGLMNIAERFLGLSGFRPDPAAGLRSLERAQSDLHIARTLLIEVYQGQPPRPHLRAFVNPRRANELRRF